jgi:predicted RNase H-like HicB family nuclease
LFCGKIELRNILERDFMSYKVTVIVQKDDNWYVAKCLENSVASQGKTVEEAINNLKEALELYYEDFTPDMLVPKQTFITTLEVTI